MRIGSSFFSIRLLGVPRQVPPPPRMRTRKGVEALLAASPLRLAVIALTVLLVGIGISIISTTDAQWWRLHFSRLGTFHDSSGAAFNTTLIAGGVFVALFARAVGRELRTLERRVVRRGTAGLAHVLFTAVGVNLALVGCVPLNVNQFVHDRVAAGMVLSFAVLLVLSPVMMHGMPKRLLLTTAVVFACLFAGGWLFVSASINLALFEVIGFSAMFAWSGVFVRCLARADLRVSAPAPVSPDAFGTASDAAPTVPAPTEPAPAGTADAGSVGLSARRARAARACSAGSARRPRRLLRPPKQAPRRPASRRGAPGLPRRGCRASGAPAASAR